MKNNKGIIVKAIGGFYFVNDTKKTYSCKIRGKLKRKDGGIMVGDYVEFTVLNDEQGVVENILPRENSMIRPKIANVNQGLIILAAQDPSPDFLLLDKLLIFMQRENINPVICFNKTDLLNPDDKVFAYLKEYENAGFKVIYAAAEKGIGKEEIAEVLKNKITVVAGPSGTGKSTTLNLQHDGFNLETGHISEKLGRGRHTTRCVELLQLEGGWVADTPGFSRLDLPKEMQPEELGKFYPEFKQYAEKCYYDGCVHDKEPSCAVKEALKEGKIAATRYERYLQMLSELNEMFENEYK